MSKRTRVQKPRFIFFDGIKWALMPDKKTMYQVTKNGWRVVRDKRVIHIVRTEGIVK